MDGLNKLYENQLHSTYDYLKAVESEVKKRADRVLLVEGNVSIVSKFNGKPAEITIDKVTYDEICSRVDVHICKVDGKKVDCWLFSEKLYVDRLDLVYRRIIWN